MADSAIPPHASDLTLPAAAGAHPSRDATGGFSKPLPALVRITFAHATAQRLADQAGVRILHVKGPATHLDLLPRTNDDQIAPRQSSDADVLVEPEGVDRFVAAVASASWREITSFTTGSAFEHAASYWHDKLGYVDIHRVFPGFRADPNEVFDRLWSSRIPVSFAGIDGSAPDVTAQRLLLLMHAARDAGSPDHTDIRLAWGEANDQQRAQILALADALDARLALAAAIGGLDKFRDEPEFELWSYFSSGGGRRVDEWRARIHAADSPLDAVRLALRSLVVNTDHLAMELGREPTRREVLDRYRSRVVRASEELRDDARAWWADKRNRRRDRGAT